MSWYPAHPEYPYRFSIHPPSYSAVLLRENMDFGNNELKNDFVLIWSLTSQKLKHVLRTDLQHDLSFSYKKL